MQFKECTHEKRMILRKSEFGGHLEQYGLSEGRIHPPHRRLLRTSRREIAVNAYWSRPRPCTSYTFRISTVLAMAVDTLIHLQHLKAETIEILLDVLIDTTRQDICIKYGCYFRPCILIPHVCVQSSQVHSTTTRSLHICEHEYALPYED